MTRRIAPALLVAALWLNASAALASSDDLSTIGPMTSLDVSGVSRVYALTKTGRVLRRSAASREWERVPNPPGVDAFYLASGLASAQPEAPWGYPRVYAVSQPNGSGPAQLWELDAGNDQWRSLGHPSGESLADAPSLAAVAVLGSPKNAPDSAAAVLRLGDGHVVTCRYWSSTDACYWEDEAYYGAPLAEGNSPIEAVYNADTADLNELWLTSGGRVELLDWDPLTWQMLPSLTDNGWWVDTTGISGVSVTGDYRVLVGGWDEHAYGDRLYVADSTGRGQHLDVDPPRASVGRDASRRGNRLGTVLPRPRLQLSTSRREHRLRVLHQCLPRRDVVLRRARDPQRRYGDLLGVDGRHAA